MAEVKRKAIQIFIGEVIVTIITLIVTLSFITSSFGIIIRNVIIANILFVIVYFIWLKLFGHYEKIYKSGLSER